MSQGDTRLPGKVILVDLGSAMIKIKNIREGDIRNWLFGRVMNMALLEHSR